MAAAPARRALYCVFFAGLLAALLPSPPARAEDPPVAAEEKEEHAALSSAPDFTARGVDGKTYQLSELLQKGPVLLDFWTTYCKPCMLELPQLQKLWKQYRDQGFTLVGVVSDDRRTAAAIKPTIKSKGLEFLNLTDADHKIGSAYNVRNYPTSVLIAPDGKISSYVQGYKRGDEKEVEKRIRDLIAQKATEAVSEK